MKAVVVCGPEQFGWEEIAPPVPQANEALVKIEVCGICNSTDSELAEGTQPYRPEFPYVLGHESIGTVIEVGAECRKFQVGDRVTRAACIMPGESRDGLNSAWGGFAELGLVRDDANSYTSQRQLVLPGDLEPETAFLSISLAETRAFIEQVAEAHLPLKGRCVVVVGTGMAGLTLTRWARDLDASPVITLGRRAERLTHARRCGAHATFLLDEPDLPAKIHERSRGRLADYLFEAIGKPSVIPQFVPLMAPTAVLAVYGAAPRQEYQAAFEQLPAGVTAVQPGPEEFRYTRAMAEALRDLVVDPGLFRTHIWTPDMLTAAFQQVRAGQVMKGCIQMRFA